MRLASMPTERSADSGAPRTIEINRRAAGNIVIGQAAVL
jgi:hypothetical protein